MFQRKPVTEIESKLCVRLPMSKKRQFEQRARELGLTPHALHKQAIEVMLGEKQAGQSG